jgi:CBF1 interacting corepressor
MQAVSFMYVRPPGYNPESAKAAELNDEKKKEDMVNKEPTQTNPDGPSSSLYFFLTLPCFLSPCNLVSPWFCFLVSLIVFVNHLIHRPPQGEKKKPRPKDVFGRALPTEEEFEVLKNAPRYVD